MKKVMILGVKGYLGYSLALELLKDGHDVFGVDNDYKKKALNYVGSYSVTSKNIDLNNFPNYEYHFLDISQENQTLKHFIKSFEPDTIFNFAQQPSAPYSMKGEPFALGTFNNNVHGANNLIFAVLEVNPNIHIINLGTMGEYPSNANVEIPEGEFKFEYKGRTSSKLPFPKVGGSWYHWSKIAMSNSLYYSTKVYDLRVSDIMQGIIYGVNTPSGGITNFYVDECFGTVLNRFIAQSIIGMPLTIYGKGDQQRAFLSLEDAIQCYKLIMNNPAKKGEYKVYNQFGETYSIKELAKLVKEVSYDTKIDYVKNPRIEPKQEVYIPVNENLKKLGFKESSDIYRILDKMFDTLEPYKEVIESLGDQLKPRTQWKK